MALTFILPDFTRNFHVNLTLVKLMETYPQAFREGVRIGAVCGDFPASQWACGRVEAGTFPKHEMRYVAGAFNEKGISLRHAYTNPLINPSHVEDEFCNFCLAVTERNDRMNGVAVTAPALEKHIRKKYPHHQIISSALKQITDADALAAELEKDYDFVIVNDSFNARPEVLAQLPNKEKAELIVNQGLDADEELRTKVYKYMGRAQLACCEFLAKNAPGTRWENPEKMDIPDAGSLIYDVAGRSNQIRPDELEKFAEMGFTRFVITGRGYSVLNNIETYLYYLAKPEHRDRLRMIFLLTLEQNGLLQVGDA